MTWRLRILLEGQCRLSRQRRLAPSLFHSSTTANLPLTRWCGAACLSGACAGEIDRGGPNGLQVPFCSTGRFDCLNIKTSDNQIITACDPAPVPRALYILASCAGKSLCCGPVLYCLISYDRVLVSAGLKSSRTGSTSCSYKRILPLPPDT